MSAVNLLPPEIRQRAQTRKLTAMVAGAGAVVLILIGFFYYLQTANLTRVNDDITQAQGVNTDLQTQIAGLQEFADLKAQADNAQKVLAAVFANEVSFSGILVDLSRVIPTDEYLTTFSAKTNDPGTATTEVPSGGVQLIGQLTFGGTAKGTSTLSAWLTNLEKVKGWVNPWIQSFAEQAEDTDIYTFSSGVDLSSDALTPRGAKGAEVVAGG